MVTSYFFEKPVKRFLHPSYAFVHRYTPNVIWHRESCGDLARMARVSDSYKEVRRFCWITDKAGFLNADEHDQYDVVAIGDSFTAGSPIDFTQMWPYILSEITGLKVYNMGHPAEGPSHAYLNWLIESPRFEKSPPSWIIWGICAPNDLDDLYLDFFDLPAPRKKNVYEIIKDFCQERLAHSPLNQFFDKIDTRQNIFDRGVSLKILPEGKPFLFLDGYAKNVQRNYCEVVRHPNFEKMKRTITELNKRCSPRNIKLAVILLPAKEEIYEWVYYNFMPWGKIDRERGLSRAIQEICQSNNIIFHDLYEPLLAASKKLYELEGAYLWWSDDTHMNKFGNRQVAYEVQQNIILDRASGEKNIH